MTSLIIIHVIICSYCKQFVTYLKIFEIDFRFVIKFMKLVLISSWFLFSIYHRFFLSFFYMAWLRVLQLFCLSQVSKTFLGTLIMPIVCEKTILSMLVDKKPCWYSQQPLPILTLLQHWRKMWSNWIWFVGWLCVNQSLVLLIMLLADLVNYLRCVWVYN